MDKLVIRPVVTEDGSEEWAATVQGGRRAMDSLAEYLGLEVQPDSRDPHEDLANA